MYDPGVVAHELAHAISWYLFPEQQHWFLEGLAAFVASIGWTSIQVPPLNHEFEVNAQAGEVPWAYSAAAFDTNYTVPSAKLHSSTGRLKRP